MEQRLGLGNFEISSTEQERTAIKQVQREVEQALFYFGDTGDSWLQFIRGKLSTDPTTAFASRILLEDKCHKYSKELQRCLAKIHVPTTLSFSGNSNIEYHEYLTREMKSLEIIIDPTIGQFLINHNHIFVGTRETLKQMVLKRSNKYFDPQSVLSRKRSFTRNWGDFSQAVTHHLDK